MSQPVIVWFYSPEPFLREVLGAGTFTDWCRQDGAKEVRLQFIKKLMRAPRDTVDAWAGEPRIRVMAIASALSIDGTRIARMVDQHAVGMKVGDYSPAAANARVDFLTCTFKEKFLETADEIIVETNKELPFRVTIDLRQGVFMFPGEGEIGREKA